MSPLSDTTNLALKLTLKNLMMPFLLFVEPLLLKFIQYTIKTFSYVWTYLFDKSLKW